MCFHCHEWICACVPVCMLSLLNVLHLLFIANGCPVHSQVMGRHLHEKSSEHFSPSSTAPLVIPFRWMTGQWKRNIHFLSPCCSCHHQTHFGSFWYVQAILALVLPYVTTVITNWDTNGHSVCPNFLSLSHIYYLTVYIHFLLQLSSTKTLQKLNLANIT